MRQAEQDKLDEARKERYFAEHPLLAKLNDMDKNVLRDHIGQLPQWRQNNVWELLRRAITS